MTHVFDQHLNLLQLFCFRDTGSKKATLYFLSSTDCSWENLSEERLDAGLGMKAHNNDSEVHL